MDATSEPDAHAPRESGGHHRRDSFHVLAFLPDDLKSHLIGTDHTRGGRIVRVFARLLRSLLFSLSRFVRGKDPVTIMANVIPNKDLDAIQFFENHLVPWVESPTMIGLTSSQCTSLTSLTAAARLAYSNQQAARDAATAATTSYHNAVKSMRSLGADLIKTIKSFAATTNNPGVYALAEIPMPAAPAPKPAPGQPTDFKISLTGSGAVELAWKSANAAGGFFTVTRKLAGETDFSPLQTVGKRKCTDGTIPQGVTGATYLVQGFRGDVTGEISLPVGVQFGVAGGNMIVAPQLKMAA